MKRSGGSRRRGSDKIKSLRAQVEAQLSGPILPTLGAQSAHRWLETLALPALPRWFVEVTLPADKDTRLDLNIYAEEWGYVFHHAERTSWIRITDVAFVHGRDDFGLLDTTPDLMSIHGFLVEIASRHDIAWKHDHAKIRTNLPRAGDTIRQWLDSE
jgi:hypothetical protein